MRITMAHGSGGSSSAMLMRDIFGKHFSNPVLDRLEDGAVLETGGRIAFSTDSFVVTPLEFRGGDIGKLAVCGTVNDLAVMGAEPRYLSCGFILEEGLELAVLDRIAASMASAAEEAGVRIVAGDTKVVEGSGGLYINTSGIGEILPGREIRGSGAVPGDAVLLSGTLGDHHACILSARMGLENEIASDCACLAAIPRALFARGIRVHAMRDVTRGGLGTVLNELAAAAGCAVALEEARLPVREEVRGLADILGLDPLYMGNEGKVAVIVPGEQAEEALEAIRKTNEGREAVRIGTVTEGKGVTLKTPLGGTRIVDLLHGEGLPRIC